ncbi:MAG: purine-nucleoside phosphorylase [Eubacterium sp.]|nr:purine-nucleoside phosphorylase [Eubacterium sp.]
MALHIAIDNKAPVAKTVLMPGDPLRAKYIADNYLEDVQMYSSIRNMYGFTGTYKGKQVSIQGSGMGMPSMGIYSWELYEDFDVDNIIRIGTAGSFHKEIKIGDIVVGLAASTDSNYQHVFNVPGQYSPSCSYDILLKMQEAGNEQGISFTAGNIVSGDLFYELGDEWWRKWARLNVLAVEMETAALYMNAAYHRKNALAVLTITDHFVTGERASNEERESGEDNMMKLALETAIKL